MNRPSLTFDDDGTPRITFPTPAGGEISFNCTLEGLAAFVAEARAALAARAADPGFREKVGGALIDLAINWRNR